MYNPTAGGRPNPAGLDFYDRLVDALIACGITPTPTLFHWDLPQAWRTTAAGSPGTPPPDSPTTPGTWRTASATGCAPGSPSTSPSSTWPGATRWACTHPVTRCSWTRCPPRTTTAAAAYDTLHSRLFTDPLLLGRYPDLAAYGHDRDALPPIWITENGCSTAEGRDDPERIAFLDGHIAAVAAAAKAGIDVRGYYVWSLLDNFEWAEGYHQRFGLIHVDFATGTRTPRASYHWLRERIGVGRPG